MVQDQTKLHNDQPGKANHIAPNDDGYKFAVRRWNYSLGDEYAEYVIERRLFGSNILLFGSKCSYGQIWIIDPKYGLFFYPKCCEDVCVCLFILLTLALNRDCV